MAEERVQKILARAGLGSRRACEQLIAAGRVAVNGQRVKLGDKADPQRDEIRVDGQRIASGEDKVYVAVYKPRGVLSTTAEDETRTTVVDLVPIHTRIYPVGRLDIESEGLMLLTNDGELTNRLTHPRYGHEKEYRVLVARQPDQEQLATWRRGLILEDGYRTKPAEVHIEKTHGKGAYLRVVMREGRKRQIRETAAQLGLPIVRLVRTRIGSLRLGNLKKGQWRHLSEQEILQLKGKRTTQKHKPLGRAGKQRRPGRRGK